MKKTDIRICGMGGQGVIMSGLMLGRTATLLEDRWATMIQSFGPEARGSTCSAQVMLADRQVAYPYVRRSDVFMAFSQAGYDRYIAELREDGLLLYESDLVVPDERCPVSVSVAGISATRLARQRFGKPIVFNMIMLGRLSAVFEVVSTAALRRTIYESVPDGTAEMNIQAFDLGCQYSESDDASPDSGIDA